MRLFSILTAAAVIAALYFYVFERDAVTALATAGQPDAATEASTEAAPEAAVGSGAVHVVALRSTADSIDTAVLLRGQTEAARQVEVRAQTSGQVISEPLRKGASVAEGQLLCQLDPGAREATLREAEARLAQARGGVPEAEARLAEAEARLSEARINDTAAARLIEGGFASQTRVAATRSAVESALAGIQSATSGLDAARAAIVSAEAAVEVARTDISRLSVIAPFEGLLETDTAELGSLLQPGALCATVIQLDPIRLVGFVPETEVDRVALGAPGGGRLASGREVPGKVTFIARSADPATRTFRVEVSVGNADLSIRDGQTVEIAIASDGASAHLIPQSALTLNDEGLLGVRLVTPDKTASFAPVSVLRDTPRGIWVDGLDDEVDIIVVGQEFVTDGVSVIPTYEEVGQ